MFIGIDTSYYRTSICLINENNQIVRAVNPLLPVEKGQLGLQPSVAVFEHVKQWPTLIQEVLGGDEHVQAIGVSTRPRPVTSSYMPVFQVGEAYARTLAAAWGVPVVPTSHQEGHIAAGLYSIKEHSFPSRFIAVHLSGGTSEVLACQMRDDGYDIDKLGGTMDNHAGQVIDRVGQKLGLSFPAGPELEKLAASTTMKASEIPIIPSHVRECTFSFSGPCSAALRMVDANKHSAAAIARAVEKNIAKTMEKALVHAQTMFSTTHILLVGGVAANQFITGFIRERLQKRFGQLVVAQATPAFSTDNAYGVACIAGRAFRSRTLNSN